MKPFAGHNSDITLTQAESYWHDIIRIFLISQVSFGHMAAIALPSLPVLLQSPADNLFEIGFKVIWRFGPESAFLFVFLSGFMVFGPLLKGTLNSSIPNARKFAYSRMMRIIPATVLGLLITIVLDYCAITFFAGEHLYRDSYAYDMVSAYSWLNLLGNILFIQPVAVDSFGSNGPLWTLGYIVQYYLLGFILCIVYVNSRTAAATVFVALIAIMSYFRPEWSILFISWLAGGFARNFKTSSKHSFIYLFAGTGIFFFSNLSTTNVSAALSIPSGILLTLAFRSLPAPQKDFASRKLVRSMANESFTIYTVHHPILMFVFALMMWLNIPPTIHFASYAIIATISVLISAFVASHLIGFTANMLRHHSLNPHL